MIEQRYLGDGVYASYDGYHIWLAVNDHTNKVVALEPPVLKALMEYERDIGQIDPDAGETIEDPLKPVKADVEPVHTDAAKALKSGFIPLIPREDADE